MILADALVEALVAIGAKYVFGVSGANIEHLHDAIHRRGRGRLSSVLAKSEMGAAFMADCRARVHRTLGVCCSTSGGGMLNLMTGIAEAYMESVPVLALVGQPPAELEGRGAFQDSSGIGRAVDAYGMCSAVAKYTAKIERTQDFWPCLHVAIASALSGRPGPAVLLFPRSIFDREVRGVPSDFAASIAEQIRPPAADPDEVRSLYEAIREARRPVLLVGHGVRRSSDPRAVVEFARTVGLPVVATMSACGEFPNDDPLFLGIVGAAGHPSAHDYLRDQADLVVVAGAGLNAMTRAPFAPPSANPFARQVIAVNIDPGELRRAVPDARVVRADVGAVFRALLEINQQRPLRCAAPAGYERTVLRPTAAPLIPPPADARAESDLRQSEALNILREFLPADGRIVFDAGNCAAAALHYLRVPRGATATIALGMGGMGYAVAGGIGAQLGSAPGTRTVVITGDGSFLITGLEVHTAVDLGLPVLYVIFNNNMHGMCVTRQQRYFGGRLEAVRYATVDLAQLARGLGERDRLWVGQARSGDTLRRLLAEYRDLSDRPGVLELCLSQEELPPFTPLLPADAPTMTEREFA